MPEWWNVGAKMHSGIFDFRFSHNIYVECLLFSRPWVCDRRIVGIEFFGPPRGTQLLLLLLLLLYIALVLKLFVNIFVFESLDER